MAIRLVYGLKTDDNSYLDSFYPARRLKETAKTLGLDYDAMVFGPNGDMQKAIAFCMGHTAILRGELPARLYKALEERAIKTINPFGAVRLADDKLQSADFFNRLGIAHPETKAILADGAEPPLAMPFVCKPRFGRMGRGIVLVSSTEEWLGFLASRLLKREPYIAQKYIKESHGKDLRFFFAKFDDSMVKVAKRQGQGLLSNTHQGAIMKPFLAPESLLKEAAYIFKQSGLVYGTVDYLFGSKKEPSFYVCEVNANPGFEAIENSLKIDAARAILLSAWG